MKFQNTKKLIGIVLVVIMIAAAMAIGISAATLKPVPDITPSLKPDTPSIEPGLNNGFLIDSNNVYIVSNEKGLLAWNQAANKALTHNSTAAEEDKVSVPGLRLTSNITLTAPAQGEGNWTPVGTPEEGNNELPYSGTVDGCNYTIYNLSVASNSAYHGFIATLSGTVKNLKFANVSVAGTSTVGTVAGKLTAKGLIENCHVLSGELHGSYYVGGIAGYSCGTIVACSNGAHVFAEGYNSNDTTHHHSYAGGITGMQEAITANSVVSASYNYGQISGHGGATGGITGYAISVGENKAQIIASYNIGAVEITTENHDGYHGFGAILGTTPNNDRSVIVNSYYALPSFTPTAGYVAATTGVGSCDDTAIDTTLKQTTQIDGSDVTWRNAIERMNTSLKNADHTWQYVANNGTDNAARPLVLCGATHTWKSGTCTTCGLRCDHAGCTLEYRSQQGGTHAQFYDVCGAQNGLAVPHSTTATEDKAATCTALAHCSVCNSDYGTVDADNHNLSTATCAAPATCSWCNETVGDALPHSTTAAADRAATCTTRAYCSVCESEYGSVSTTAHTMTDATCAAPKTCSTCGATEGNALPHTWIGSNCTTPKTCSVCKATEGTANGHRYTNDCDADCNTCDAERTPAQHLDENGDLACDVCNAKLADAANDDGLSVGAIVGIVIGAVVVACGLGALGFWFFLKKKNGVTKATENTEEE